jgi:outer membrane protein assembly factor BamD
MAAYSNYRLSPNYKLDQTNTLKAIEGFEQFINAHPNTERAVQANAMIDKMRAKLEQKSFEQGNLYYKIGQYQAAMTSFQNTLKDFPESQRLEEVRFLILKSSYILASNSIFEKQEERYLETLQNYNQFVRKHPNSRYLKEAQNIERDALNQLKIFK